jgi:hypothetical protein
MYCARHQNADYEVHYADFDTAAEAEDFARQVLKENGGGKVEIFGTYRTIWANGDGSCHMGMAQYNVPSAGSTTPPRCEERFHGRENIFHPAPGKGTRLRSPALSDSGPYG